MMEESDDHNLTSLWLAVLALALYDLQPPPRRGWAAWCTKQHGQIEGRAPDYVDAFRWLFTADFATVACCAGILPEVARGRLIAEAKATWQTMPAACRDYLAASFPASWPDLAPYVA